MISDMAVEIPNDIQAKILLVDDESNVIKALRRLFMEVDQYVIFSATSGSEALVLLENEPEIAVIISDQKMPEMTGVEFLSRARFICPDAVRILLTGYAEIESTIAAINQGAVYRYLTKPWDDNQVLQAVSEAVNGYWLKQENLRLNSLVAKKNEELQSWNARLKQRVLEQTAKIRAKNEALAEKNRSLKENFTESIGGFAALIQMRDHKANGHSQNVAVLVRAISEKLQLPENEQEKYYAAALLHDIGKIGMSDRLLSVPKENLNGDDLESYQQHVVCGQIAIETMPALGDIGFLIRHHHERYDGRGFPDRLKGTDIPLGSRLIHAADALEHQLRRTTEEEDFLQEALQRINKQWETYLDPGLRIPLEESAQAVYPHLNIIPDAVIANLSPKELKVGMELCHDLYTGTGVLLLKKGTVFDKNDIEAVSRNQKVVPFEKKVSVIIHKDRQEKK